MQHYHVKSLNSTKSTATHDISRMFAALQVSATDDSSTTSAAVREAQDEHLQHGKNSEVGHSDGPSQEEEVKREPVEVSVEQPKHRRVRAWIRAKFRRLVEVLHLRRSKQRERDAEDHGVSLTTRLMQVFGRGTRQPESSYRYSDDIFTGFVSSAPVRRCARTRGVVARGPLSAPIITPAPVEEPAEERPESIVPRGPLTIDQQPPREEENEPDRKEFKSQELETKTSPSDEDFALLQKTIDTTVVFGLSASTQRYRRDEDSSYMLRLPQPYARQEPILEGPDEDIGRTRDSFRGQRGVPPRTPAASNLSRFPVASAAPGRRSAAAQPHQTYYSVYAPQQMFAPLCALPVVKNSIRNGPWSLSECERYEEGLQRYPHGPWKSIADHVGTRTERQVRSRSQSIREKRKRHEDREQRRNVEAKKKAGHAGSQTRKTTPEQMLMASMTSLPPSQTCAKTFSAGRSKPRESNHAHDKCSTKTQPESLDENMLLETEEKRPSEPLNTLDGSPLLNYLLGNYDDENLLSFLESPTAA